MASRRALLALFVLVALGCDGPTTPDAGPGCTPGSAGCACAEGDVCELGLVCTEGLCERTREATLTVTDPAARSCEILVIESGTEVRGALFPTGVEGTWIREAPRSAVVFHATADAPLPSTVATIAYTDEAGASLVSARGRCFDARGQLLSGAAPRLELQ